MKIELLGHVDDNCRLNLIVPANVQKGPVRVVLEVEDDDPDEFVGVADILHRETGMPESDVFAVDDGNPVG